MSATDRALVVLLATVSGGCNAIFGQDDLVVATSVVDESGAGGTGGAGGAGGGYSSSTGTPDCDGQCVGEDCEDDSDCESGLCRSGVCALLNGCAPATAEDFTGSSDVFVLMGSESFDPRCLKVSEGADVMFIGNFSSHHVHAGEVVDGRLVPDSGGPFDPPTTSGQTETFGGLNKGDYGFYCEQHGLEGHNGALFVR